MKLAFIGSGIMGEPMCGHLLAGGHAVALHSRTKSKAERLIAAGATWCDSPADAARDADIIFVNVPDTPDVGKVLLGVNGVIESARPGTIAIDHSTISPTATREMASKLAAKQVTLLDAPVSGGDVGAKNATLSIMVGGDKAAFDRALPLLQLLGKTITYAGRSGNGQLTKLVNQILVSVTNLAVSEAMNFAQQSGLDAAATIQAVGGGAAGSWQLQNLGPKMLKGDFTPGFMIDLQQKDLRLVLESAKELNLSLRAVALVSDLFATAQSRGWGREGTQALFKTIGRSDWP